MGAKYVVGRPALSQARLESVDLPAQLLMRLSQLQAERDCSVE
jgi:hypothetical protein